MSDDTDGPAPRTVAEEHSLGPMRRTIANRLQESYQNAVHVTVSREVDAEALVRAADALDDPVSLTDVLLSALSDALESHPAFNGTFEDGTHRRYEEHNVGVAVDIDAGLVTPVIADVGSKSPGEIAAERRRLTELVQRGEYDMSDLRGGTITVSNLGVLGVDSFTPVINPPEVAILGVGRIVERARPGDSDDDGGVEFRRQLTLDLSFDHRVVDGADAARFLGTLAEHVEDATQYIETTS
ncbi:2-oxo acid dehydrogenase subunit E2 [Natronoarchaeum sp. GCM10025703]|uniref:2-oxo acid dehydrogenase subunit E2 n=1 Tax=unclassified Natronoarchaeum TaxID=2620183 RepID=UPI003613D4C5